MVEADFVITVAPRFDPKTVIESLDGSTTQVDNTTWSVTLPTSLHGLALVHATSPDEVLQISGHYHPTDAEGWQDWTEAGPDEFEMTTSLLPRAGTSRTDPVFRYDDAWVWDPEAPPVSSLHLERLGIAEVSDSARLAAAGRGGWVFKAVKIAWKGAGHVSTAVTVFQLGRAGWRELRRDLVEHRARMEQAERLRRAELHLLSVRRERLETGSLSSRRKARQYYTTLDALIAANS